MSRRVQDSDYCVCGHRYKVHGYNGDPWSNVDHCFMKGKDGCGCTGFKPAEAAPEPDKDIVEWVSR